MDQYHFLNTGKSVLKKLAHNRSASFDSSFIDKKCQSRMMKSLCNKSVSLQNVVKYVCPQHENEAKLKFIKEDLLPHVSSPSGVWALYLTQLCFFHSPKLLNSPHS